MGTLLSFYTIDLSLTKLRVVYETISLFVLSVPLFAGRLASVSWERFPDRGYFKLRTWWMARRAVTRLSGGAEERSDIMEQ